MKKTAFILALLAGLPALAQLPMLLDHGRPQLIGVPPNQALVKYIGDTAYFYGDSVTEGYNPTQPQPQPDLTNRFSTLLCHQLSMVEDNFNAPGTQIADAGESQTISTNLAISNSSVSVWLAGYNDVFNFGTSAAALNDNLATVEALAAWLAVPTSMRAPWYATTNYGIAPNTVYYSPGDWQFSGPTLGGLAISQNAGGYASFYFTGSTLLIGTARGGSGGNISLVVGDIVPTSVIPSGLDPYITNTYSCLRTSPTTAAGTGYSASLIVITNLSPVTNHYAFFYAQSSANVYFSWYAAYSTNLLPKVVLAGTLKPAGSNYVNIESAPFNNGSNLAADEYSQMLSNAAATLATAKLNVSWVPAPNLNSNTDYFSDNIHPNASGHQKLAAAIQSGF